MVQSRRLLPEPKVVFMGTPDFSVASMEAIVGAGYAVKAVVTQPDRPRGRGRVITASPVKRRALALGLRVLQPDKISGGGFFEQIKNIDPDIIIVVAFGQILKRPLLDIAPYGAINIHASLLPRYRGPAPIQWAIMNGDTMTGLTSMRMEEGLDTGPILLQKELAIAQNETFGELHDRLAAISGPFLLETLDKMKKGTLSESRQNEGLASYAPKLGRELAIINWELSSGKVSSLIRAMDPYPGAITFFKGSLLKIFSSCPGPRNAGPLVPGRISAITDEGIVVETGAGTILIRQMQVPGKKRLTAVECARGLGLKAGSVFGS